MLSVVKLFFDVFHGLNDFLHIGIGHGWIEWQAEGASVKMLGIRAFSGRVAVGAAIPWLQVNGDVEDLGADALFSQFLHDLCAGFAKARKIDADCVEVQGEVGQFEGEAF